MNALEKEKKSTNDREHTATVYDWMDGWLTLSVCQHLMIRKKIIFFLFIFLILMRTSHQKKKKK